MPAFEFDAVVFDVLGTLVDEPAGIRAGIRAFGPALADPVVDDLVRPPASSDRFDLHAEGLADLADRLGG
ncbi:hypothetical protein [Amycolatopsis sp. WQ 127309]|uniref:hypothetical protein n=1 Tax=Amycolatopsis sp. WQ 127309 TaxID=2932773 RepID=UPI001FF576FC|nr:hypothetical protein [Amycolatopsis sp. WQ 127309]UOZ03735.1 hypothetical protein MUY22_33435 [Amycolatopsis sp. WQ 127309]